MSYEVNFFMYVVFRYLYTQPQPTNNAIYNIQDKVYLDMTIHKVV